ncbi:MAG: methyltransferase [Oscillospiraceae bacterium]|nr:methyltransferase [Oscillospiraceae bacterium]
MNEDTQRPAPEALWPGGPQFMQAAHFRLGTDSVLLADFVNAAGAKRGIDLGCASGIEMLLLLARTKALHMTGLEIVPEAAALARENMAMNGLSARAQIMTGDIRDARALFRTGSFDLVVCNPPYFPEGSGALPLNTDRAAARSELLCTLPELCGAAAFLLCTGGRAFFVHRPERLAELFVCLTASKLEPKRLRLVCRDAGCAASLVLVEARRGGRPGLTVEPALYLRDPDGSESAEYRRIYHRDASSVPG